jgi:hypothetical protein
MRSLGLRAAVAGLAAACLAIAPALADQVLYCVDTSVVGFRWDEANTTRDPTSGTFVPGRYIVRVSSVTERTITRMAGDTAGTPTPYTCSRQTAREAIACDDGLGWKPWVFYRNTYTRAFLAGPPAGGADPNISVAHGVCTNF